MRNKGDKVKTVKTTSLFKHLKSRHSEEHEKSAVKAEAV